MTKLSPVRLKRRCIECGEDFVLTEKDIAFFERMGYDIPKRCLDCRRFRRLVRRKGEKWKDPR